MKKINKYFAFLLAASFMFTACNDEFLNTKPLGEVDETSVWTDLALAEAFVVGIYQGLGNGGFDEQMLASLTDEAMFTHRVGGLIQSQRPVLIRQISVGSTIPWHGTTCTPVFGCQPGDRKVDVAGLPPFRGNGRQTDR